jgi:glycosyltransferase involved in cell wall biosynthesis
VTPLVSILIPAYNAERWIVHSLQSALEQTWINNEIIVVDDGSTDNTFSVARQFQSSSVKIVSQSNRGASAARNRALDLCQGDYIQWLDADDILAPDKIEKQLRKTQNKRSSQTLLSSSWSRFYYRLNKARRMENCLWYDLQPVEWIMRKMRENAWMAIESWLVSRELVEVVGPWDTTLSADDDGEYFCRLVCASDGIMFVPDSRSYVRKANLDSLSKGLASKHRLESQFHSMRLQIRNVLNLEDSPRVRSACLTYLQRWLIHFYPARTNLVTQMEKLAVDLGGHLEVPRLPWKYKWIQRLFGWDAAKRASSLYNRWKSYVTRGWDKSCLVFRINCAATGAQR